MILSVSRRTDIPAFYSDWFINRIRAGYCTVQNPFNHNQISKVSMKPEDIDVIVFWSRNPSPLIRYLQQLDDIGFRYYFQFTIMNNPRELDPNSPSTHSAINIFKKLSERIGPQRIIWRYDPIVFSNLTGIKYHLESYKLIASQLKGYTKLSIISIVDIYKKTQKRIKQLQMQGVEISQYLGEQDEEFTLLMENIVQIAASFNFEIHSCSEVINLTQYGIKPGKCIDDQYINKVFGISVTKKKDPNQRAECGCVVSKDIGMYDTCIYGCQYCYATSSLDLAKINHEHHNPNSPSLLGWHEPTIENKYYQGNLFTEMKE